MTDISVLQDAPNIAEFYAGKTIFITGGSGFMGKVLIEKLLYSCPDLKKIYLLLRSKKGVEPKERIKELYTSKCFNRLQSERAGLFEEKVSVINGDVMQLQLGISEEDRAMLIEEVNIIFHVAASVRFTDYLTDAVFMNIRGTREIVEMSKEMKKLLVLLHVSTGYSNTNRKCIEEKMYPPLGDWRDTIEIAEKCNRNALNVLTHKYIGEMPNTYVFTKQLAEHLVYEEKGKLPAVIVRPSIVISSYKEPFPGWIENLNGPVGIAIAVGIGIMRSFYCKPSVKADYIPVDIAILAMVVAAWQRGVKELKPTDDIPIYNCCAGDLQPMTMTEVMEFADEGLKTEPPLNAVWKFGVTYTTSRTLHYFNVIFLHVLPALIIDLILRLIGRQPMVLKVQRRIYIANLALEYYITREWSFKNDNMVKLRSLIRDADKDQFYFEMETIDVHNYFNTAIEAGKEYQLKQARTEENRIKARAHAKRLYYIDLVVKMLFWGYFLWWLSSLGCVKGVFTKMNNFITEI